MTTTTTPDSPFLDLEQEKAINAIIAARIVLTGEKVEVVHKPGTILWLIGEQADTWPGQRGSARFTEDIERLVDQAAIRIANQRATQSGYASSLASSREPPREPTEAEVTSALNAAAEKAAQLRNIVRTKLKGASDYEVAACIDVASRYLGRFL